MKKKTKTDNNTLRKTKKYVKNRMGIHSAAKTIQRFMKTPKVVERRVSLFLKNICSNSKTCIAFGIEQKKIYDFFDGYTNKEYIKLPILPIEQATPSQNGFINKIEYVRDGYKSHAILKTSLKHSADNLVYEYIVGKFLNKMSKFYPGIMQTYALIEYGDDETYNKMRMSKEAIQSKENLESIKWNRVDVDSSKYPELLHAACTQPLKYAVLTQHIQDSLSLSEMVVNFGIIQHTILSLHQIYFTLHCMRNNFTHYDLHLNNILCYNVGNYRYIEFKYYMNDGSIISYNYNRLAYMIDYGRCYFYESDENNSKKIFDELCKAECPSSCGQKDGFKFLLGNPEIFINGTQRNMSADLRAMKLGFFPAYGAILEYKYANKRIFDKVVFNGQYSTPEVLEEGFTNKKINNVSDAFRALTSIVAGASEQIERIYRAKNYTKSGTLHIYEDGITPMRYDAIQTDSESVSIATSSTPIQMQPPIPPMQMQPPIPPMQMQPPVPPVQLQPPIPPMQMQPPIPPTQMQPPIPPMQMQPPIPTMQMQPPIPTMQMQPPVPPVQLQPIQNKIDTRISRNMQETENPVSDYIKQVMAMYQNEAPPPFRKIKRSQPIIHPTSILRQPTEKVLSNPPPTVKQPVYDPRIFDKKTLE